MYLVSVFLYLKFILVYPSLQKYSFPLQCKLFLILKKRRVYIMESFERTLAAEDNISNNIENKKITLFRFNLIFVAAAFILAASSYYIAFKYGKMKPLPSAAISAGFFIISAVSFNQKHSFSKIISWLLFVFTPPFCFYIVEVLNKNSIVDDLTFIQGVLNIVWYSVVLLVFYFVIRRRSLASFCTVVFSLFIGVCNHYILVFRGTTIFPCDLFSMGTAANVAGGFDFTPDELMIYCFLLSALFVFALLRFSCGLKKDKLKKKFVIPVLAVICAYSYAFFNTDMLRALDIYAQQWKTQANGFLLNFTAAVRYSFVDEPKGYGIEEVQKIADSVKKSGTSAYAKDKPVNIIAIMNESCADYSIFDGFTATEDPLSYYHSLKENTIKGYTCVSVTGGGTANSEFEFLTGNTLAFLPQSTVAYQLYFNEDTPSSIDEFNSLGYETAAFHPYIASGWNRPMVYKYMGFDKQLFKDDAVNKNIVRKYISDSADYETLYSLTDECKGDMFIFNVTMQNHSGYSVSWDNGDEPVYATGEFDNKDYTKSLNQYLSLLKATDNAIKELVEHYKSVDEPTLIVFFGDHQPPLSNDFYEDLYGKKLDDRTAEETMMQYKTPFFIWANYDIEEEEGLEISLNYLMAKVFETADIPLTKYQMFLKNIEKELPVVNRIGVKTKEGYYVEAQKEDNLSEKQKELLKEYEYIQYNNLFDDKDLPDSFFNY